MRMRIRMVKRELVELEGIKVTAYLLGLTWTEPQLKIEYEGKEIDLTFGSGSGELELDVGSFLIVKERFTEEQLLLVEYVIENLMDEDKERNIGYGMVIHELQDEYKERLEKLHDEEFQKYLETLNDRR